VFVPLHLETGSQEDPAVFVKGACVTRMMTRPRRSDMFRLNDSIRYPGEGGDHVLDLGVRNVMKDIVDNDRRMSSVVLEVRMAFDPFKSVIRIALLGFLDPMLCDVDSDILEFPEMLRETTESATEVDDRSFCEP
jgi:hypothetical protein